MKSETLNYIKWMMV